MHVIFVVIIENYDESYDESYDETIYKHYGFTKNRNKQWPAKVSLYCHKRE